MYNYLNFTHPYYLVAKGSTKRKRVQPILLLREAVGIHEFASVAMHLWNKWEFNIYIYRWFTVTDGFSNTWKWDGKSKSVISMSLLERTNLDLLKNQTFQICIFTKTLMQNTILNDSTRKLMSFCSIISPSHRACHLYIYRMYQKLNILLCRSICFTLLEYRLKYTFRRESI